MWGLSHSNDRKWKITVGEQVYYLTEYNDEITGYDDALHSLAPDIIHYSGNAYYATGKFAQQRGWIVEEMPRSK